MLGLVVVPVLIGVVVVAAVTILAGPTLARLVKDLARLANDTLSEIRDTWRSE